MGIEAFCASRGYVLRGASSRCRYTMLLDFNNYLSIIKLCNKLDWIPFKVTTNLVGIFLAFALGDESARKSGTFGCSYLNPLNSLTMFLPKTLQNCHF